mgnify:CR=1 FL=1
MLLKVPIEKKETSILYSSFTMEYIHKLENPFSETFFFKGQNYHFLIAITFTSKKIFLYYKENLTSR